MQARYHGSFMRDRKGMMESYLGRPELTGLGYMALSPCGAVYTFRRNAGRLRKRPRSTQRLAEADWNAIRRQSNVAKCLPVEAMRLRRGYPDREADGRE